MSASDASVPLTSSRDGYTDSRVRRPLRILVVDDDRSLREGCVTILEMDGHTVTSEGRSDAVRELIAHRSFDLVLLDVFMTPVSGLEILAELRRRSPQTLVVMMSGNASTDNSIEAFEAGAWEYLSKPFSATQLSLVIGRAAHELEGKTPRATPEDGLAVNFGNAGERVLLGISPAFRQALALARQVAPTDASVVITGESGTGKEMVARFIHANSRRAGRVMVPINCAALPEPLLESEMFGHRRGAFTGADREKVGLLEAANEGTMFLDEITEMSQVIQAKFLRVLQDGIVRRVGSEEEGRHVDVRIIAATNRVPVEAVRAGRLRQDLYFRLWVFPIHLPPLRERPEDIVHLTAHFLTHFWLRHRGPRVPMPHLPPATVQALAEHPWPGNVRELQNTMERLAVTAEPGGPIWPEDVARGQLGASADVAAPARSAMLDSPFHPAKEQLLADFERRYLTALIQRTDHNLSRAARLAGIDRTTLYRLLEKHGFDHGDGAHGAR